MRGLPGVAGAALSFTTPVARGGRNTQIVVPPDSPLGRRERMSWVNLVSPGWFDTLGLRLTAGRDFTAHDRKGAPAVIVVNRAFARRFLPGVEPVGAQVAEKDFGPGGRDITYQVVGVVEDAVYRSLRAPMEPTLYMPFAQEDADAGADHRDPRGRGLPASRSRTAWRRRSRKRTRPRCCRSARSTSRSRRR